MTKIKSWQIPFRVGGAIQEPAHFVGHQDDAEEIFKAMLALQNISLRGERRTGKTSLLLYLAHPESVSPLPDNHIPVYFNLQIFASARAVDVWLAIAAAIAERLEEQHPEREAEAQQFLATIAELITPSEDASSFGAAFGRGLTELKGAGFKIHLLFDEFDQTVRNPKLGDSFYDTLRSLPTRSGNISYVIASRTGLSALQPINNKASSPFFNIFTSIVLKPLREDEVYRLIFNYFTQAGLDFFLAEKLCNAASFLYQSTGYHPFFLQALCYHLCARLDEPDWPAGRAKEEALRAFERDAKAHFEFYWDISAEEEQEVMRKLALGTLRDWNRHRGVIQSLQDRCLVIQSDSDRRLFSSAFAQWINDYQIAPSDEDQDKHELPLRSAESYDFENREGELREILTLLEREPYLHLYGASGVGKTTLIGELLAERYREHDMAYFDFAEAKFEAEGQNGEQLWREIWRQFYKTSLAKEFSLSELLTYFSSKINQAPHYGVVVLDNIEQMAPAVRRQLRRETLPALQEKIADAALYLRVIAISCRERIGQGTGDGMAELRGMGQISFQPYPLAPFASASHHLAPYQGLLRQAVSRWGKQPLSPHDSESNKLLKGWATQLYDLTAGHPAAIEATLNYLEHQIPFAQPDLFETQRQAISQHVLAPLVLAQVQASFPSQPEYQQAFQQLWVFRYLSKGIFRRLLAEAKGKAHWEALNTVVLAEDYEVGQTQLWEKLNATPLLEPEIGPRFFSRQLSPIWRQLGNLMLRLTNQALYQALHADARAVFDHFAFHHSPIDTTLRLHCFVEAFYHLTQAASNPSSAHSRMDLTEDILERLYDFLFLLRGHEQFSDALQTLHDLFANEQELRTELERIGQRGTLQRLMRTIERYIKKNVRDKNG